jgi:hypothetical protein
MWCILLFAITRVHNFVLNERLRPGHGYRDGVPIAAIKFVQCNHQSNGNESVRVHGSSINRLLMVQRFKTVGKIES